MTFPSPATAVKEGRLGRQPGTCSSRAGGPQGAWRSAWPSGGHLLSDSSMLRPGQVPPALEERLAQPSSQDRQAHAGLVPQRGGPISHTEYLGITYCGGSNADGSSALGLRLNQQDKNEKQKAHPCDINNVTCHLQNAFSPGLRLRLSDMRLFLRLGNGDLWLSAPGEPWRQLPYSLCPGQQGEKVEVGGSEAAPWRPRRPPWPLNSLPLCPQAKASLSHSSLLQEFQATVQEAKPLSYRSWGKEELGWWGGLFFHSRAVKRNSTPGAMLTGVRRKDSGLPVPVMAGTHLRVFRYSLTTENSPPTERLILKLG